MHNLAMYYRNEDPTTVPCNNSDALAHGKKIQLNEIINYNFF